MLNIEKLLAIKKPKEMMDANGNPIWETVCNNCNIADCNNCGIQKMLNEYSSIFDDNSDIDELHAIIHMASAAKARLASNYNTRIISNEDDGVEDESMLLEYVGTGETESISIEKAEEEINATEVVVEEKTPIRKSRQRLSTLSADDKTDYLSQIAALWQSGNSLSTIAKKFNAAQSTIAKHLISVMGEEEYYKYMSHNTRKIGKRAKNEIVALQNDGVAIENIADKYSISADKVQAIIIENKTINSDIPEINELNAMKLEPWKTTVKALLKKYNVQICKVFIKMRNVYGIVLDQLKKEYNRSRKANGYWMKVPALDAIAFDPKAKDVFNICLVTILSDVAE